jgi:hypothetical protein
MLVLLLLLSSAVAAVALLSGCTHASAAGPMGM